MQIVILHGWGHNAAMWKQFAARFHAHKVLILEMPGFGNEKLKSPAWDIDDYANWVISELSKRKIRKAIFIGHSFGGKVATQVTLQKPALVQKLVLVASPLLRRPSSLVKFKIKFYKSSKKLLPNFVKKLFFDSEYKSATANNLGEIFKKSVEYDRTKAIQSIKQNVLIVWGEIDNTAPLQIAREMQNLIKNSHLEVIKGKGHNLHFESPDILYGLINKFINE